VGTSYLCPLALCISNTALRCSTWPFSYPTAIWSPAQSNTQMFPRARKKATGAEFFTVIDPLCIICAIEFVHEHQVTVCGKDVPAYFLHRVLATFERENSPRKIKDCVSVPSLMFQKLVLPLSSPETTISLLRNPPVTQKCSEQFCICRQSWCVI